MKKEFKKKSISFLLIGILVLSGILPQMKVYAKGQETPTYNLKISYYMEDTSKAIAPSYEAVLPQGESYEVKSPEIEGYSLKDQKQATISGNLDSDTAINVFYTYAEQKAQYTVNYIGRSIDGDSEKETELGKVTGEAEVDSVINVEDKVFEGYVREPGDLSLTVTQDGQAVKNVYYTVKTNPCIIFNTYGDPIDIISEAPGTDISEQMDQIKTPQRKGYIFDRWDKELPNKMPEEDYIINAVWEPAESEYTVLHWFQNAEDDGYSLKGETETRTATTETEVTATPEDWALGETTNADDPYYGFDYSHTDKVKVEADGNSVLNVYYNREIWEINIYNNPLNDNMSYEDYQDLQRDLWWHAEGKYGSSTVGKMPALSVIEGQYKDNPFEGDYNYINLIIADQSDRFFPGASGIGHIDVYFGADDFTIEGIQNTHKVDLFPFYSRQEQKAFYNFVYGQSLNDPEKYELLQQWVGIGKTDTPTDLSVPPFKGFTNEGGSYRSDKTAEKLEGKEWTKSDEDNEGKEEDGTYKFRIFGWTEIRQQRVKSTLTFNSGGDIVETVSDVLYETPLDDYLTQKPTNGEPDMKFAGWYENPDLFDIVEPVKSGTMPPNDLTLFAKWVPVDFTVTFDTRGGSEVPSQTVQKGTCAVLPEAPTRENYTFAGWYTSDGKRWNFDTQITGNTMLYALWKPIPATGGYTIKHILKSDNSTIAEYTGTGMIGDTFAVRALNARDKDYVQGSYIVPDALTKSITLKEGVPNEVSFFYDMPDLKDYTVSYLEEGTGRSLHEDKIVNDTHLSRVTEFAESIAGYTPDKKYKIADLSTETENKIVFYYTKVPDASLTISKTVTGKLGNKDKDFTMEILLKQEGAPVTGSFPISGTGAGQETQLTFDKQGKAQISLKHNESVTITGLKAGMDYQVTEVSVPAGYEVTYNGESFDSGIQGTLEVETTVSVVNHYEEIPVTDLNDHGRSGLILAVSAGGLLLASGFVLAYRRRKQRR